MQQRLNIYLVKAVVILQIALVTMIAVNNTLFIHHHILPNGDIVTHAHPYKKSGDTAPFKTHTHTISEFFLLSGLNDLVVVVSSVAAVILVSHFVKQHSESIFHITISVHSTLRGRAPPVSL